MLRWLSAAGGLMLAALLPQATQAPNELSQCIATLRRELPQHTEVRAETFDTYTRTAQDLRPMIEQATSAQPEFQLKIWDYLARRADAQRAEDGRALMASEADTLTALQRRHGVDAATVVSVFGVETDYGRVHGRYPVVDATLSRACLNLGSGERKSHLFAALWLLQEGLVQPDEFRGSWAGAFGMTQFMPGTFVRFMDEGDGTGRPDIIHSVSDALATTARYLNGLGWADGLPWGVEVRVPPVLAQQPLNAPEGEHGCLAAGAPAAKCRNVEQWSALGVTTAEGAALGKLAASWPRWAGNTRTALLMPAGPDGPAWLVTANYQALWRYNRADAYALAIGLLSDALRGAPPQRTPWPTDDPGISRAELRELQALLRGRGHCEVSVDGAEGPRTVAAVKAEESRLGWPETGHAGLRLLNALRARAASQVDPPASAPTGTGGSGQGADAACPAPPAAPASAVQQGTS